MPNKTLQQKRSYGTAIPSQKYYQSSQQPLSSQGGMMQTLKDSLVGGLGAGIGMNIADRAISSIFGARKVEVQHTNSTNDSCGDIINIYKNTLSKGETIPQSLEERYNKCVKDTTW